MAREARFDLSRYKFSEVVQDSDGNMYLEDREPLVYQDRPDNIPHIVSEGDTWRSLAQFHYWYLDWDAGDLWWAIADYQPIPIINPFAPLKPGKLVIIPSPEFLSREVLSTPVEVLQ